jgi:hypothetical protein
MWIRNFFFRILFRCKHVISAPANKFKKKNVDPTGQDPEHYSRVISHPDNLKNLAAISRGLQWKIHPLPREEEYVPMSFGGKDMKRGREKGEILEKNEERGKKKT